MNVPPPPHEPRWGTASQGGPYPPERPAGNSPHQGPGRTRGTQAGPDPQARQPVGEGPRYPLASWSARAAARLVDLAVIALPAILISLVLALTWAGTRVVFGGSTRDLDVRIWFILWPIVFVLYTAYETYAISRWQRTFGKRMMGLKVAPLAAEGRLGPIPFSAVLVRAALYAFPALLFFTGGFWFVLIAVMVLLIGGMAAWNRPNHQGLHDRIAGTVVLDVR